MTTKLKLAIFLSLLAACATPAPKPVEPVAAPSPAAAEIKPTTAAKPPEDPGALALPLWPEVTKGTLPNGLTYYILKHGKPEKRAMLWLAVKAGSVDEDDDQRGLAHFDEHMAFDGTAHFPKDALIQYIESIGMRFGADLNAYTAWQQTVYQLEVPTDDAKFLEQGFEILRDWAGGVSYDPAEIAKERGVVLEEWRLRRSAGQRLFDKQAKVIFQGTRYADRMPIGLPEIIENAKPEALTRFYKDWYRPDQMAVIVVGEIEPAAVEKIIQSQFADLKNPEHERPPVTAGVPQATGTRVTIEQDKEAQGVTLSISNLIPKRSNASRNDARRGTVQDLYTEIFSERLGELRRKADAPFLFAGASISNETLEIDALSRRAIVKGTEVEAALRLLLTEALRAERYGFTEGELERARAVLKRNAEASMAREATSSSRDFAAELGRNFTEKEYVIGRAAERDLTLEFLPLITVDELRAVVKSFGGAENRVIAIGGPEGENLPDQAHLLQVVAEVEASQIAPWDDKPVPKNLMSKPPAPGKIVAEKKTPAIDLTEWDLSNGIRVIIKPTDYEKDSVLIDGSAPGGLATASDAEYPDARFAAAVVSAGGLGDLDAETVGKVLAGKRAFAGAWLNEVTQGVNAGGSPHDLETIFQLIHLRLTAPRKDEQQVAVWKNSSAEMTNNALRSPEYQYAKASAEALYDNNLRHRLSTAEDYQRVDLDKAFAFYKERFRDLSNLTFVIVGEVDLLQLKPLVETYLASLPGQGRKEREKDLGIRKVPGVVEKTWHFGIEPKASVRLEFHGDERWTREKERDLYVLDEVLRMRLRELLREDLGGVYGVSAGGSLERSPHQERDFSISFGCAPTRIGELIKATMGELAALEKKGIGPDYLEKVKQTYLRSRETELRTNNFWLARLNRAYRFGDDPLDITDTKKTVARMTSANLRATAKKFLDPRQLYRSIRLPEDAAAPAK